MSHLLNYQNVAQYLSFVLKSRKEQKDSYSLRTFAKDLGVAPSTLSEVLVGAKGVSRTMSERLVRQLKLTEEEGRYFYLLANTRIRRAASQVEKAKQALTEVRNRKVLSLEVFQMISEWQHFAVYEALKKKEWRKDMHPLAQKLGISAELLTTTIKRLRKLGLVDSNNQVITNKVSTVQDAEGQAITVHLRSLLRKALVALEAQPLNRRDFQASQLIFDVSQMEAIKGRLQEFHATLAQEFGSQPEDSQDIFCLFTQFFNLTPNS